MNGNPSSKSSGYNGVKNEPGEKTIAIHIAQAQTDDHIQQLRALLNEYLDFNRRMLSDETETSNISTFRSVTAEMAELPGIFAPPRGRFLIALDDNRVIGCAALRPVSETVAELKRMYVRPEYRGQKIGWRLAAALVDAARNIGYSRLTLDSHYSLTNAHMIYKSLGFDIIPPPDDIPEWAKENMIFMALDL